MAETVPLDDTWDGHECEFGEVIIEAADDLEGLVAGDKVLTPCRVCGETPLEHLDWQTYRMTEMSKALMDAMPVKILYHWSPASRRKMIKHYGLRPGSRAVTSSTAFPVICLADSPSWAWALSGEQRSAPLGEWDLWQTRLDVIKEPIVLADDQRLSGIHEVRTEERIWKRDLWYVGSRMKLEPYNVHRRA